MKDVHEINPRWSRIHQLNLNGLLFGGKNENPNSECVDENAKPASTQIEISIVHESTFPPSTGHSVTTLGNLVATTRGPFSVRHRRTSSFLQLHLNLTA